MIRALIADDEPLARRALMRLLRAEADIRVIGECGDGESAVAVARAERPGLIFLDIRMPERDGFAVVDALLGEYRPAIVFVTAYDRYALRAFEVHAVDYLLKPFSAQRLGEALKRVRERMSCSMDAVAMQRLLDEIRTCAEEPRFVTRIPVTQNGRIRLLPTSQITHIEAEGNYARLHAEAASFEIRETLQNLEKKLDPAQFLRIHRSTIINLDFVREVQPWFRGGHLVVLKDATEVRLSRYQWEAVERLTGRLRGV